MSLWQVSVFDTATDALVAEYAARSPDRDAVRVEWGLPQREPVGELLVTEEHFSFVNALLEVPLTLSEGHEAYLGEFAEYDGEVVEE